MVQDIRHVRPSVLAFALCCTVVLNAGAFSTASAAPTPAVIWLEAEQFHKTGGWSNDSQFVDLMGSPYLLATGLGKPVADAVTTAKVPADGAYRLWVRCRDWLPEHHPGLFQVIVGPKASPVTFGKATTDRWQWVGGGVFELAGGEVEVRLHDVAGWWGRCDAVILATDGFSPANDLAALARQRLKHNGVSPTARKMGPYDVVVVGGGPAGCGAAVAAARNGCSVALIQDRPVLGGNASSEIEIPPMGYIGKPPDTVNVTGLAEEFFGKQGWSRLADSDKIERIVRAEKRVSLFLNTRATGVEMAAKDRIRAVIAINVHDGQRMAFAAPLFVDCTGHGWIGFYAGAQYRVGQEARAEFNESLAPVKAGKRTMGNSLYKAVIKTHPGAAPGAAAISPAAAPAAAEDAVPFDCPPWAHQWKKPSDFEPLGSHRRRRDPTRPLNFDAPSRGKGRNPGNDPNGAILHAWWVEYGGVLNTIDDAETIRDELFRISLGLWNYAKNHNPQTIAKNKYRELVWLNYVPGVRESRRLVGDYIMTQQDYDKRIVHADTVAFTDWGIDVHHPEGYWVRGNDCIHVYQGRRTSIPYRTLYSRNISNLFMAGRCHSATHVALGGTRVMRPMCATGQAAGTAAAIARSHGADPRGVYQNHITQLQQTLLKDGCYLIGVASADTNDLARNATATASSSAAGMGPEKAINGWNRVVGDDRNAWSPQADAPGPHWLELRLDRSAHLDTAHVTFEAAGAACRIEVWLDGRWQPAADIPAAHTSRMASPRRRVMHFEPVHTDKVRLIAAKPSNRPTVCEIRLYNKPTPHSARRPRRKNPSL